MRQMLEHLFGSALGRFFGEEMVFAGAVLAFACWCIEWALIEARRRPAYAVILVAVGAGLVAALLVGPWALGELVRATIMAAIFYAPLYLVGRRMRRLRRGEPTRGPPPRRRRGGCAP